MKQLSAIFIIVLLAFLRSAACPAFPGIITVSENGDTAHIRLKGDENMKYAVDEDGYSLLQTADGWFYATADRDGYAVPSSLKLSDSRRHTAKRALKRGLRPRKALLPVSRAEYVKSQARGREPVVGDRRVLVILMQFSDIAFCKSKQDFNDLFNAEDYRLDGANGSVADFFNYASYGQLNLKADVIGPCTSMMQRRFYGENTAAGGSDANPYALFREALDFARETVNLADYDADHDGFIDNIHIIYAGHGEEAGASASAIWAHEMTFPPIDVEGLKISKYSCAPELRGNIGDGISRIGPHCHEIGHALGTMDFYDTDYATGGSFPGTGIWDIMASGSWNDEGVNPANFNPYTKVCDFGWVTPRHIPSDSEVIISPSDLPDNIYRLETGVEGDYYLLENRQKSHNDVALPGEGLLIFHVGPDIEACASQNRINSTFPQQCYPVCASSDFSSPASRPESYGDVNSAGCPFPGASGKTEFSSTTVPAALTFSGGSTGIELKNIRLVGSDVCFSSGNTNGGSGDDSIPPVGGGDDILWMESFENLNWVDHCETTYRSGDGYVRTIAKLSPDSSPYNPAPSHGRNFISHSRNPEIVAPISTMETSLRFLDGIDLEPGEYSLMIDARYYSTSASERKPVVTLIMQSENGDSLTVGGIVDFMDDWQNFSLDLNAVTPMKCFVKVILSNSSLSTLFIDRLRIVAGHHAAISKPESVETVRGSRVFDILGRPGANTSVRGVFIERDADGRFRKRLR